MPEIEEENSIMETQEDLWAELQYEVNQDENDHIGDETIQYLIAEGWTLSKKNI